HDIVQRHDDARIALAPIIVNVGERLVKGGIAVGVHPFGNPAVPDVVIVLDLLQQGALVVAVLQAREPVTVIPGVIDVIAGGDLGTPGTVAFGVVGVVVRAIGEKLVVVAGGVAADGAVTILVVGVVFVRLVIVVGADMLAVGAVGVAALALAADQRIERVLRHAAESVVAPAVIGKLRGALLVGKPRQPADVVVGVRRGGHQFRASQVGVAVDG